MIFQLLICSCLSLSNLALGKSLRIIGGKDADIKEFPYIVSLKYDIFEEYICSGAIITNRHILTAAHCFEGREKSLIRVFVGIDDLTNYLISYYSVTDIRIHPDYIRNDDIYFEVINDIAIAAVTPTIEFNEFQNKIDLPTQDVVPGDFAVISGWGWKSYPIGNLSEKLQSTDMQIISNFDCERDYPYMITRKHLCAFQGKTIGICFGDSGGPLVSNKKLVGISSFTNPCALGDADIYTRVYAYLDFIEFNIAKL